MPVVSVTSTHALVQHSFNGSEMYICKNLAQWYFKFARPYFHTSESTMKHFQETTATQKLGEAVSTLLMEKGGETHVRGVGCLPQANHFLHKKKYTKDTTLQYNALV